MGASVYKLHPPQYWVGRKFNQYGMCLAGILRFVACKELTYDTCGPVCMQAYKYVYTTGYMHSAPPLAAVSGAICSKTYLVHNRELLLQTGRDVRVAFERAYCTDNDDTDT